MIDINRITTNSPLRIIAGAGEQHWDGWIPTQKEELDLLRPKEWEASFHSHLADAFLCEQHIWEHLAEMEEREATKLCSKYLKPGGYLRCAVPDANFPNSVICL